MRQKRIGFSEKEFVSVESTTFHRKENLQKNHKLGKELELWLGLQYNTVSTY